MHSGDEEKNWVMKKTLNQRGNKKNKKDESAGGFDSLRQLQGDWHRWNMNEGVLLKGVCVRLFERRWSWGTRKVSGGGGGEKDKEWEGNINEREEKRALTKKRKESVEKRRKKAGHSGELMAGDNKGETKKKMVDKRKRNCVNIKEKKRGGSE